MSGSEKFEYDFPQYAEEYSGLGVEGTYFLAFRDVPNLLKKYANGKHALDYGCGAGRSTQFCRTRVNTIGIDHNNIC